MILAIEAFGAACEKHLDHFAPGTADTLWLPAVASRGWVLLTTDARIRHNLLEKEAVRANRMRMFYFSRNNLAGTEMGKALARAMPEIARLVNLHPPPFTASINKSGEVQLRDTFGNTGQTVRSSNAPSSSS